MDQIDVLLGGYRGYLAWLHYFRFITDSRFRLFFLPTPGESFAFLDFEKKESFENSIFLAKSSELGNFDPANTTVCIGWRFLVDSPRTNVFVVHDSLLPDLRGWNPVVTSLQKGYKFLGLTLFRANDKLDSGPIINQVAVPISYPMSINLALTSLAKRYADLFGNFFENQSFSTIEGVPQNDHDATFSLWRDEDDLYIDWTNSASTVMRFIDSVKWPYTGARTRLGNEVLIVEGASIVELDVEIVNRVPGKVFSISNSQPTVVCGSGFLRLHSVFNLQHLPVKFDSVRTRLR